MERYEVVRESAGEGGYGRIDQARDVELERCVAIKLLDPLFRDEPSATDKERFRREAKTVASLSHPNIPAVYDVEFPDPKSGHPSAFKIIFEWIDGITVREWLTDRGAMTLDDVRKWFTNICSALDHAHSKGIVHRDIKPSNLIITHGYESCYLVDWGISLSPSDVCRLTSGSAIGSPGYMSPEQEKGEELHPQSDLFSLGVVLYECLSGERPAIGAYRPLNSINEGIPPAVDDLIRDCLRTRETRVQTAAEFSERLVRALRPTNSFPETLAQGALHEIQAALNEMTAEDFALLSEGQRVLIKSRLTDLVKTDMPTMKHAVASLLSVLVRVAQQTNSAYYGGILTNAFDYGYKKVYGDRWQGSPQLRSALNQAALEARTSHRVFCTGLLAFISDDVTFEDHDKWYYHDLRILLQNLLANTHCTDEHAGLLGEHLERVNELSHRTQSQVELPVGL